MQKNEIMWLFSICNRKIHTGTNDVKNETGFREK